MAAYDTVAGFRTGGTMPPADVDLLEAKYPGTLLGFIVEESAWLDDALRRRYWVPFGVPAGGGAPDLALVPVTVRKWVRQLVTPRAYLLRGVNSTGEDWSAIVAQADRARSDVRDAADPEKGPLPELPLRADMLSVSGVALGGPMVVTYTTIHGWVDALAAARDENGW